MSGTDRLIFEIVVQVAKATKQSQDKVRQELLEDGSAFADKYGEYLTQGQLAFLGENPHV